MKRSKKFTTLKSYIPEDVLEEIESTEGLKPKNRRFVSKTGRDYDYFADYRIQSGNLEQFHLRNDNLVIRQIFLTIKICSSMRYKTKY